MGVHRSYVTRLSPRPALCLAARTPALPPPMVKRSKSKCPFSCKALVVTLRQIPADANIRGVRELSEPRLACVAVAGCALAIIRISSNCQERESYLLFASARCKMIPGARTAESTMGLLLKATCHNFHFKT